MTTKPLQPSLGCHGKGGGWVDEGWGPLRSPLTDFPSSTKCRGESPQGGTNPPLEGAPLHFILITVQNCSRALRAPGVLLYFSETFTNSGIFPLIRWCRTGLRTRTGR